MNRLDRLPSDLVGFKLFQENYIAYFFKMLWTCSATFSITICASFHKSQPLLPKKDTKKPLQRYRKQGGFQKQNSLLIFDALMQRLLHLSYLIHQITTMQRHITKIFDIHFLLLFEQFHLTKKIRRIMPDFMDILYFVCEQNTKTNML